MAPTQTPIHQIKQLIATQQWLNAIIAAERWVQQCSEEVTAHHCLAQTLQTAFENTEPEPLCLATLQSIRTAYTTRLALAYWYECQRRHDEACQHYFRASRDAQSQGFWFDDGTTPPWLRERVKGAMQFVAHYRHHWFAQLMAPLEQQFGRNELTRVHDCVAMYLGEKPKRFADPRQQPSFLYFPDLPIRPLFERELFPWAEWFEAQTSIIRDEMLAVLSSSEVEAFHHYERAEQAEHLFKGAAWDAYFFYRYGHANHEHLTACPHTASVLQQLPQVMIRDHAPETCFSILRPGTHILPHRGVTNIRSVLHLPLILPGQCTLNVIGVEKYEWQLGRSFAFDDTYEHEAWNRSEQTRVILLTDIWNPFLREAEQLTLTQIIEAIGDFNRAVESK